MFIHPTKDIPNNRVLKHEKVEGYFPGFIAFIDCTEQQIPRSVDKNRGKIFYSGKKKKQTNKNQLTVNKDGFIIHKATYKKGRRHDYIYKNIRKTTLSLQKRLLIYLI
jgi:hypothetical protein